MTEHQNPFTFAFREGDEVVLAKGTYQGAPGIFLRLTKDIRWADIQEAQWKHPQPSGGMACAFRLLVSPAACADSGLAKSRDSPSR